MMVLVLNGADIKLQCLVGQEVRNGQEPYVPAPLGGLLLDDVFADRFIVGDDPRRVHTLAW